MPVKFLAFSAALLMGAAQAAPVGEALDRPAATVKAPDQGVVLGAAVAGSRWLAVGERGLILQSANAGQTWQQVASPVSTTLTAVRFADARFGLAVGHGGVVLVTEDGGQHWARRLDGRQVARQLLDAAKAGHDTAAEAAATQLLNDGPDKPWLDVATRAPGQALIVGAFGLAMRTTDGGRHWTSIAEHLDNPKGLHLYAVRQRGERVLIAGEQGLVLLSEDGGATFKRVTTPYRGSFFAAELPADGSLLVAGLRGHVLRSANGGADWAAVPSPDPSAVTGIALAGDAVVMASQSGHLQALRGEALTPLAGQPLPPLNGVVALDRGRLLALTVQGPRVIDLSSSSSSAPSR